MQAIAPNCTVSDAIASNREPNLSHEAWNCVIEVSGKDDEALSEDDEVLSEGDEVPSEDDEAQNCVIEVPSEDDEVLK